MNARTAEREVLYLRLVGRLYPDGRLELRPAYLTENSSNSQEDPKSPLRAELYDDEGRLLLRYYVPMRPYYADGKFLAEMAVRGKIPFPSATRLIRFYKDNVLLHEIEVSRNQPQVQLTWSPSPTVKGKQIITWRGSHPDRQTLHYFLRYTHTGGERWQRIGWRTEETRLEVDFDQLPGGKQCRIAVVAADGINTVTIESEPFSVPVKSCKVMILAPEDGALFDADEPVLLRGQGYYLEENKAETENLLWTSSKDGELGKGMTLQVRGLSPGSHNITLRAGTDERAGEETISIQVGEGTEP